MGDFEDLHLAIELFGGEESFEGAEGDLSGEIWGWRGEGAAGLWGAHVSVELQPEVVECVGGVIGVGNGFAADKLLVLVVDADINVVVSLLLPVAVSWCAGGGAIVVGCGEDFGELAEFVWLFEFAVGDDLGSGRGHECRQQAGGRDEESENGRCTDKPGSHRRYLRENRLGGRVRCVSAGPALFRGDLGPGKRVPGNCPQARWKLVNLRRGR